jgi:hypothetical protein
MLLFAPCSRGLTIFSARATPTFTPPTPLRIRNENAFRRASSASLLRNGSSRCCEASHRRGRRLRAGWSSLSSMPMPLLSYVLVPPPHRLFSLFLSRTDRRPSRCVPHSGSYPRPSQDRSPPPRQRHSTQRLCVPTQRVGVQIYLRSAIARRIRSPWRHLPFVPWSDEGRAVQDAGHQRASSALFLGG